MNVQNGFQPHRGTLILVLGILSLLLCAILGPFAWVMGKNDVAKIDAGVMDPTGRSTTFAGMVCGIIGTVFLILGFAWLIFILVAVGAVATGTAGA